MPRAGNTKLDTGPGEMLCRALVALATGALLGVLVALPYDRLLGLPTLACTVLRSATSVALLGALQARCPTDLGLRLGGKPAYGAGPFQSLNKQLYAVLGSLREHSLPYRRMETRPSTAGLDRTWGCLVMKDG